MLVPIESIVYSRRENPSVEFLEGVENLKASFEKDGQFHPIIIGGNDRKLVTGAKRLEAAIALGWKEVDATMTPVADEEGRIEIHFKENLVRENLSWYEIVDLRKALHDLRQRQFGTPKGGNEKTGWSLRDTARELDVQLSQLSDDITLAKAAALNPQLRKVKDRATALKLVKEARKRSEQETEAAGPVDFDVNIVMLGDSADLLPFVPENSFDAVITDPPWLEFYKDKSLTKDESTIKVFKECYRVMKHGSFLYAIVSTDDFYIYRDELPRFGFRVQQIPLIWVKGGVLTHGKRSWEYARDYEPILLAVKGSPALTKSAQISSIYTHKVVPSVKLTHPHEKPIGLIEAILSDCTYDDALVLDPFAGSGVVLSACKKTGRRYIGLERNKAFYDQIIRRLK